MADTVVAFAFVADSPLNIVLNSCTNSPISSWPPWTSLCRPGATAPVDDCAISVATRRMALSGRVMECTSQNASPVTTASVTSAPITDTMDTMICEFSILRSIVARGATTCETASAA